MKSLTENNFNEIIKNVKKAIILITTSTCKPCSIIKPILKELSKQYKNIEFYELDAIKNNKLIAKYRILSVPTLLTFVNGKFLRSYVGLKTKKQLEDIIKELNETK